MQVIKANREKSRGRLPRIDARDDQVFLIMGVNDEEGDAQVAIVIANDLKSAKTAFSKSYRGSVPMTWPSLKEIKRSVEILEEARNGGVPDDISVINQLD